MPPNNTSFERPSMVPRLLSTNSAKASLRSYSSSFEADDERSDSGDSMGPEAERHRRVLSEYPGEDTRLTSKKELAGWYMYGWAAEVFVICGMGSFIPITLEQLARENGVLLKDHTTSCISDPDAGQCVITFLGFEINTASFAMYSFSLSVLFQFLVVISISCAADHGQYRKKLLLFFAWTGATATMLFLPITSTVYLLGALLAITANTCLGASFVLLNSFLPLLVRHHPEAEDEIYAEEHQASPYLSTHNEDSDLADADTEAPLHLSNSATRLLSSIAPDVASIKLPKTPIALRLSTQISSFGIGISYFAALLFQTGSIVLLLFMHSTTFSLRLVLFFIGLWWFLFTIPSALWLRPRPGPPLPAHIGASWSTYISHSWISLYRTIKLTPELPDILLFLVAWFLLSDAIATVSGVSILFAKTSLGMSNAALALISVLVTIAGISGAFSWPYISKFLNWTPLQTIICSIVLFALIPLYGLLDYLPFLSTLSHPWEMYPLALVYGFVLGGLSSYCRSLYGELIPPGSEAAFYALYAITDKGSSIFGPTIVGMIVDRTGGIRPAFWFLIVLVSAPAGIICWVDVKRGKAAAHKIGRKIEEVVRREGPERNVRTVDGEEEAERLIDEEVES